MYTNVAFVDCASYIIPLTACLFSLRTNAYNWRPSLCYELVRYPFKVNWDVVGIGKHLCGAATGDLINALIESRFEIHSMLLLCIKTLNSHWLQHTVFLS